MAPQPSLFTTRPRFDSGIDLTPADQVRLTGQIERVYDAMRLGGWWTVEDVAFRIESVSGIKDPETSISAQIRNLRKAKFGGHTIERRRVGNGFQFRLVPEGQ